MIHKSPAIRENYQSNHSLPTSSLFREIFTTDTNNDDDDNAVDALLVVDWDWNGICCKDTAVDGAMSRSRVFYPFGVLMERIILEGDNRMVGTSVVKQFPVQVSK